MSPQIHLMRDRVKTDQDGKREVVFGENGGQLYFAIFAIFFSFKDTLENQNGGQMFFCYFFLRYPRKPEKQVTLVLN